MQLKYLLTENDFLQAYLYDISKNEGSRINRLKASAYYPAILFVVSIITFVNENISLSLYFLGLSLLLFITTFFRIKYIYFKNARKALKKFQHKFNVETNLKIEGEIIEISDSSGILIYKLIDCTKIIETLHYFYIEINDGNVIIPKSKVPDVESIQVNLKSFSNKFKIPYVIELDWKW